MNDIRTVFRFLADERQRRRRWWQRLVKWLMYK